MNDTKVDEGEWFYLELGEPVSVSVWDIETGETGEWSGTFIIEAKVPD